MGDVKVLTGCGIRFLNNSKQNEYYSAEPLPNGR